MLIWEGGRVDEMGRCVGGIAAAPLPLIGCSDRIKLRAQDRDLDAHSV